MQGIALPLAPSFPAGELRYIVNHSEAAVFVTSDKHASKTDQVLAAEIEKSPICAQVSPITSDVNPSETVTLKDVSSDEGGLMLYTSGTTSRPKGVLLPGATLTAQENSLIQAWNYSPNDRLLHCLPLHHIHGTMNALLTPLFAGSTIEFLSPFTPEGVWNRFAAPFLPDPPKVDQHRNPITFFTVVPTIYSNMLNAHPKLSEGLQKATREGISPQNLRVNISGSAALPTPTKSAWTELSYGNVLLERFGMTEVGMALSCGLSNADRVDGSVGWPLPSVQVRLVDTETNTIIKPGEEIDKDGKERQGEIQLRGPTIFKEYFKNPKATVEEFVDPEPGDSGGKWFKTGDVATRKSVEGAGLGKDEGQDWATGPAYFIAGRKSADIIKSGGEKVSALEVEREMLSLPEVHEVAVVGVPSAKWGQKVGAIVVLTERGKTAGKDGGEIGKLELRNRLKERLVAYKCPLEYKFVRELPRNAMGKINKKQLVPDVFGDRISPPPGEDRK